MHACNRASMGDFVVLVAGLTTCSIASACAQQPAAQEAHCVVRHVADGDSFRCEDGRRVRLIGIDSPELDQRPFGSRARQALLGLVPPGTTVKLEHDVALNDRYGRRLGYAWNGSVLVNEAMVRGGWAVLYTVPPNIKYAERLRRAQNEARTRGAGLWAQNGFACLPQDFRKRTCLSPP